MSDIEKIEERTVLDDIKDIEDAGLLYVKGYSYHEIATLMSKSVSKIKHDVEEYKKILNRQVDNDPYFLERIQFNTIKALQEFDQLSKEAWETVNIATDHGMVPARIQALKLCGELATKKAQLHKLLGSSNSDGDYIARMQKAESVNQILSKILKDVIAKHPSIAEEVRRELAIAFEIMGKEEEEGYEVKYSDVQDAEIVEE